MILCGILNPGHIYNYELKLRIKERYHEDGELKKIQKKQQRMNKIIA